MLAHALLTAVCTSVSEIDPLKKTEYPRRCKVGISTECMHSINYTEDQKTFMPTRMGVFARPENGNLMAAMMDDIINPSSISITTSAERIPYNLKLSY